MISVFARVLINDERPNRYGTTNEQFAEHCHTIRNECVNAQTLRVVPLSIRRSCLPCDPDQRAKHVAAFALFNDGPAASVGCVCRCAVVDVVAAAQRTQLNYVPSINSLHALVCAKL